MDGSEKHDLSVYTNIYIYVDIYMVVASNLHHGSHGNLGGTESQRMPGIPLLLKD